MKLRKEASVLRAKAIASLRWGTEAFNSYEDDGRVTTVLLHYQHAFEMLLKAMLVQEGARVFDARSGEAIGFEKCVRLSMDYLGLTDEEAGTARAIDALRDAEQHWHATISEGLLYTHARAGVTLFDDLLKQQFGSSLADYLPRRVLPLSAEAPMDFDLLVDEEYSQIADLLRPGLRRRSEAQARIRTLLAMEAHAAEEVRVSQKDVRRVQRGVVAGKPRETVFPRLTGLSTETTRQGLDVTVRFSKKEGAPVRFVTADDATEVAAIREVDLQKKYHWSASGLAKKLNLTQPKATALRRFAGIDADPDCRHEFVFGSQRLVRYSDNAYTKMRDTLQKVPIEDVWRTHGFGRRSTT